MLTYKPTLVTIMSTFKVIVDIKLASVLESIEEHYKLSIDILDENHDIIENVSISSFKNNKLDVGDTFLLPKTEVEQQLKLLK